MATTHMSGNGDRLWAYSLFGAVLSAAGLPIYIFAPKFFADTYGVSLATLGAILFALRLVDVVQDPVLGWVVERLGSWRKHVAAIGAGILGLAMIALFAVVPPGSPVSWFTFSVTLLFSAFSMLTILFYAQGVAKADTLRNGHMRLAGWRETGALLGVCAAAMAPTLLSSTMEAPYAAFAFGFAVMAIIASAAMASEWRPVEAEKPTPIRTILSDKIARRLLILALVNATPLAVSSTLFLFFVESRLNAPGWEGGLLVLFFLSAAISAPVWSTLSDKYGARPVLLSAMVVAILSFAFTATLGAGDVTFFAIICIISGATIGADLVILPAMFARRMGQISPFGAQGFGLWSFTSKFTLAFAAVVLLPLLDVSGFVSGGQNTAQSLTLLTILYAGVPCLLKTVSIAVLATTPIQEI
jgi:GPH family glycoside/pentoside/hexuronide:cation symporter